MNRRLVFLLFSLIFNTKLDYGSSQETPAQMTSDLNQLRATAIPLALRMTCLTWNSGFATTVASTAASCTIPTGANLNLAYDVRPQTGATVESFFQVANDWYSQLYDLPSGFCFDVCDQYLTIMNEKANSFACSQATCAAGSIAGCTSGSCTYTLCQFDANRANPPYVGSSTGGSSCTTASCAAASDPTKSVCANFLCCGATVAGTTTTTTTTTSKPTTTSTTTTTSKPTTTTTTTKPTTTTTTTKPTTTTTSTTTSTTKPTTTTTTKPTTTTTSTTTTTTKPTTTTTTTKPTTTTTTSTTTSKLTTVTTSSTTKSSTGSTSSKPTTASTTSSTTKPTTVSTATTSTTSTKSTTKPTTRSTATTTSSTTTTSRPTSASTSTSSTKLTTATTTTTTSSSKPTTTSSTISTTTTSKPVTIPSSSSVFCNKNGAANWWCASDQPEGQQVSSAVAADSCFCVMNQTQTQQQAFDACAAMGGFLTDIQNSDENTLIGTILAKASISSINCPSNSSYFNGSCYQYFYQPKKSWNDAEKFCQTTYGGHLPSIHSNDQQNFLVNLSRSCFGCPVYGFWVGGNNYGSKPTKWQWSDGSGYDANYPRLTQYRGSGWEQQPEDPTNQQCMTLVKPDGGWGDWFCSWAEPYHCQFSPNGLSTLIGLQKTTSGNYWSVGTNCQMNLATYQGWSDSTGSSASTAFVYNNGVWTSILPSATASSAVCRIDRKICGRNPCGTCNSCSSTNGGKCFNCSQSSQSSTIAPTISQPSSTSYTCGSSSSTTNWFCAKSQPQGQSVTSAVAADSCFCLQNQIQSQRQALSSCEAIGGFLTDIQNADENRLISNFLATTGTSVASSSLCPTGSTYYDGSCYVYISSPKKNWLDAENYCKTTYGGHLATIYSNDQQDFLFNTVTKFASSCNIYGYWVGGYNGGDPDNWRWSDGSNFTQFPNVTRYKGWAAQPDFPKTQNCMTLVQFDGGWGDWLCNQVQPFVCQIQITSFWIGLQKSATGHYWNLGDSCQMAPASYQNLNSASDTGVNLVYSYLKNQTWNGATTNSLANSAICRWDRNICGRNSCPTCNQCKPTIASVCNSCSSSTTSPSTASILCNTAGTTTDWWCANNYAIGQAVTSAVQADSCFCVMYQSQTQQQAFDSCSATGGFLTDIQNSAENSLIGTLLQLSVSAGNLPSFVCPANSYYFNGLCYAFISNIRRSWQDAETYCQATYGGHLASIHSDEQQDFIFGTASQGGKNCTVYGFWIGGNNYGSNPIKWSWSDGTLLTRLPKVTNNTAWAPQPEDPKAQQCMTIVPFDGGWGDWYCSMVQPFVCQYPVSNDAWIGLQRTLSGHNWNTAVNCQANSATYQAWNQTSESLLKSSYLFDASSNTWQSMYYNSTANAAVCRLDRNVCGRKNCPSCSSCTSLDSGKCYQCGSSSTQSTTSKSLTSTSATLKTTSSFTFACNTAGATTNWWCAKDYAEGQSVSTALAADSCYCIMSKNQTQQQAFDSCINTGGFLTDIQNSDENALMNTLFNAAVNDAALSPSLCPTNAVYMDGYCYIYQSTAKVWQAAETFCQSTYSGHLASIHSVAQQDMLVSLSQNFKNCPIYGFWVGANNYGSTPTTWLWSDGSFFDNSTFKLTQYSKWPQQPDNPKAQQCMTIVEPDGGWGDWYCTNAQPFVCQFPAVSSSPWIGLQKGLSGRSWNIGNNCQLTPATYMGWNQAEESNDKIAYTFGVAGSWSNAYSDSLSTSAICRRDRNICGRNVCPSCSTCAATNSGGCYKCS